MKEKSLYSAFTSVFKGDALPVGDYFPLLLTFNLKFNRMMIYMYIYKAMKPEFDLLG